MKIQFNFKAVMSLELSGSVLMDLMKVYDVSTKKELCDKMKEELQKTGGVRISNTFATDDAFISEVEVHEVI